MHITFLPELIISSKLEEVEEMCKFQAIRTHWAKAQISQKMHKILYDGNQAVA